MLPLGYEPATFVSGTQRFVDRAKAPLDIYIVNAHLLYRVY